MSMERRQGSFDDILRHIDEHQVVAIAVPLDYALEFSLDDWQSLAIIMAHNRVQLLLTERGTDREGAA